MYILSNYIANSKGILYRLLLMTRNPAESSPELLKYSVKLFLSVGQVRMGCSKYVCYRGVMDFERLQCMWLLWGQQVTIM